jgi:hypothetical protein
MSNPKEKAKELVEKMNNMPITIEEWNKASDYAKTNLKREALIVVDEILNLMIKEFKWDVKHNGNIEFWQEVKQAIKEL